MNTLLKDRDGNTSSKRVTGIILVGLAIVMYIILFVLSMTSEIKTPDVAMEIPKILLFTGSGLLGLGVVEYFKKPKENTGG